MKQIYYLLFLSIVASQISELNSQALTDIKYRSSFLNGTFPKPFNEFDNPHNAGAVSTGYYITTNETQRDFSPKESFHLLTQDVQLWKRIVQGPRVVPQSQWINNPEGLPFFRNPALPSEFNGDFFRQSTNFGTDSTDNAIAGPIPINLDEEFYFNGVRFDSFYVSTSPIPRHCSLPVELVYFNGELRGTTADLSWETASEENNYGFYVERRVSEMEGSSSSEWTQITFIRGAGNSKINQYYNFSDEHLMPNFKYEYRLRQVDFDGTESCDETSIVVLSYSDENNIGELYNQFAIELQLEQNSPNPFSDKTTINFTLTKACNVNLDVVDIYGNVVAKIIDNIEFPSGTFNVSYSGQDFNGKSLPSGTYVYCMQANNKTISGIMTLIR